MMKNVNRGLLVIAALLLVATIGLSSYAIYKSSATGEAEASVANWAVKVNTDDIVTADTLTFNGNSIEWAANAHVAPGKIAPGKTGTITFVIDASQSEVSVDYELTIGDIKVGDTVISNDAITASIGGGNATGTINYSDVANDMKKTVTLDIVWTATDSDTQNAKDMALAGEDIKIPVTIVAKQHIGA